VRFRAASSSTQHNDVPHRTKKLETFCEGVYGRRGRNLARRCIAITESENATQESRQAAIEEYFNATAKTLCAPIET
jgi:hypothetical protein